MKMQVEFESLMAVEEFVKAWVPVFMPESAVVPDPVTAPPVKKKKPPKQKAAEPEETDDQAETEAADQAEAETAEAVAEAEPEETDTEDETVYSLEEVREALAALNKAGKRAEVKELLLSFGADRLSKIPKEQYGEVMAKAGEL